MVLLESSKKDAASAGGGANKTTLDKMVVVAKKAPASFWNGWWADAANCVGDDVNDRCGCGGAKPWTDSNDKRTTTQQAFIIIIMGVSVLFDLWMDLFYGLGAENPIPRVCWRNIDVSRWPRQATGKFSSRTATIATGTGNGKSIHLHDNRPDEAPIVAPCCQCGTFDGKARGKGIPTGTLVHAGR
jgi:hypothetical protein